MCSTPTRTEVRVQRRIGPEAEDTWADLYTLPADTEVDETKENLAGIPTRRLVKVSITETFEVI